MAHNTIAVIADCDDTLAPDTTGQLLLACGLEPSEFFSKRSARLVKEGWDPVLAYLWEILKAERSGEIPSLTKDKFEEVGRSLTFYPGVPECIKSLREEVENSPEYRPYGIRVEFYVISSGIQDLISAAPIGSLVDALWASNFSYGEDGRIEFPKNAISFTDKTRYLFLIQKGRAAPAFRNQPYVVNELMEEAERRVPFKNMIYLGDGPSDIPCMSLLNKEGGFVIGLLDDGNPDKTWALGYGRRANLTVPQEFTPDSHAYKQLRNALIQRADGIRRTMTSSGPVPGF